jgi:hypothetical protein
MHAHPLVGARPRLIAAALTTVALLLLFVLAGVAGAHGGRRYHHRNLVSDIPGLARFTDPNLVDP